MLKKLIDPSAIETTSLKKDITEFVQLLDHHYFIAFDNISNISDEISDALCRAVSGDGFSKRGLYTDDDDIIYSFKRGIGLNGINLVATKPDLLERSILLELERIQEDKRKTEQELFGNFEKELPFILGGIFDVISKAIKIKPTIKLYNLPRMADFTLWGCAIAEAMGCTKENFLSAYYANINHQNEEVIEENPIATALQIFMKDKEAWEGTPSELLTELTMFAQMEKIISKNEKGWAYNASDFSKKLNKLKTNLESAGILIQTVKKNGKRLINIKKITSINASIDRLHDNQITPEKLFTEANNDRDDWVEEEKSIDTYHKYKEDKYAEGETYAISKTDTTRD